jgi:CRISPR-associated exonuclease Cas4
MWGDREEERLSEEAWAEDELVPISALEHYSYCPRQCALIHREQTFDENLYTLRGRATHRSVEEEGGDTQGGVRVERALPVWSETLGLVGKTDLVEFQGGVPYPVEYKHGIHSGRHALLQLCAQALCLEEMMGIKVEKGAIFESTRKRRREVIFTQELREKVDAAVREIRRILHSDPLPPAVANARCPRCSLFDSCLPQILERRGRLRYLRSHLFSTREGP